ncbi:MAG: hypothetical protein C4567_09095 [Deltaproteobacteria bacterium]|nr:MAG: hypothetical protein C4567_09095 [Deltaproteobacteria bacterium]
MTKILPKSLMILASLFMTFQGVYLMFICPWSQEILGSHGSFAIPFFIIYPVAFYLLINYLLSILNRRGEADSAKSPLPTPSFSWLASVSLILVGVDYYLLFHVSVHSFIYVKVIPFILPLSSIAGILTAIIAIYRHKKGHEVRWVGMAVVGLICGGLFLLISFFRFHLFH